MAEAAKKKKSKGQKRKLTLSDTQRWVLGIVIFAFAVFLLAAVVSYYFYWRDDQSYVSGGATRSQGSSMVMNPTGPSGAVMADYVVGEWFGVFGLAIPILLIIIALRIINYRPVALNKSVRIGVIIMILGSLSLGYLFGERWGVFGTGLGGAHGIYLSEWISSYIGRIGCGMALLLGWILLGVYISRRTISVVNRVGKGIYNGGRAVGGAVASHAADFVSRGGDPDEEDEEYGDGAYIAGSEGAESAPMAAHDGGSAAGHDASQEGAHEGANKGANKAPQGGASNGKSAHNTTAESDIEIVRPDGADEEGYDSADTRSVVENPRRGFTVVSPQGDLPEPEPAAAGASNVVMLGEAAGAFIVGSAANGVSRTAGDESRYAGGVGRYTPQAEKTEQHTGAAPPLRNEGVFEVIERGCMPLSAEGATGAGNAGSATGSPEDASPFTVEDGGAPPFTVEDGMPLSAGGVVESASAGGVKPGDNFQVVVAGRKDAVLSDDEADEALYDPTKELSRYQKPPVELLEDHSIEVHVTEEEVRANKDQIINTLKNFGISIDKIKATIGPTVTLYEIIPSPGVKISKIKNLEDDIALSLKALGIRIIAPMPGKGTVGIEVPNKDKEIVSMYSVVKTRKFKESDYELPIVLGKTISNETFMIDLAKMPHLLVAGSTGQGKSVGLNAIITSLLYKKHPSELKFVLVDPKRVELSLYAKLERHFLAKMPSEEEAILTDTQRVVYTLNALCVEMSQRYDLLRMAEVKKLSEYNEKFVKRRLSPKKGHRFMPYIVVVVDEFADMIMTAGREVEAPITRLAQLARAVGIHLVIATQRPDVKVITGLIKANFPARIAFRVMSMVDSRTIIDQPGANQLIGRGDMLMSLNGELSRVQCAFIDTPEIERITEFIGNQRGYTGAYELPDYSPEGEGQSERAADMGPLDPMFDEIARFVVQNQQGSTSSVQRRFSIGYNRAGRIMDQLEDAGVVGRAEGSKPREVLIMDINSLEYILGNLEK